ncbi:iron chelate uptake ABC transporter family permease subunit [Corynebacterium sp.]|uniref:FecCD family ABC transporter permease n=1 Tax=Corynebacterium sp. TaxID=1720 RepID=UPI0026DDC4BF|nr:iron ABC transporter permease [Corynebacterium sp.]MDO5031190.1 iron ABC transporter permease [Corynebacterium sp.]
MSSPSTSTLLRHAHRRQQRAYALRLGALLLAVIALWWLNVLVGEKTYSFAQAFAVLRGETVPGASFTLGELRLPRATIGAAAGVAFGVSGVIFQRLLRNQLASPEIIGISSASAASGVTAIIGFHASQSAVSAAALAAGLGLSALVYVLSLKSGFSGTRLILIGIGFSALLQAWINLMLTAAPSWDLPTATRWITGSLNSLTWQRGAPLLGAVVLLAPVAALLSARLSLLQLGDELPVSLGVRLPLVRVGLILCAVGLISVATSVTGPIAFLAFMSGPIAARLFPLGSALILPSAAVGAALVLGADFAGQYLLGHQYPVGVVTGALGAPFLINLLTRINR